MPNVADSAIARLQSMLDSMPPQAKDDPRYQEAQNKLNQMKMLNNSPVTGPLIDAGLILGDATEELITDIIPDIASDIANATLDLIRGLGSAILDGLDATFDAAAAKLEGREPAVISGLTVATIGFLTAVFLYNAAKSGRV